MLLVDNRQAEAGELDFVFDQGVSADHDRCRAGADLGNHCLLLALFQAAGEPCDFQTQGLQPCRQLAVMLLGKDFRRRHQGRLMAGFDRLQHGQRGDHRLAAADIAL